MIAAASTLHRDSLVIDACSFFSRGWHDRLAKAGVTALQMTIPWPDDGARRAIKRYSKYYQLVAQDSRLAVIQTVDDIRRCHEQGRVGFIFASQNARMLEDDIGLVEVYHSLGVRVIQLTYNERNLLADGCLEPTNAGLSRFGKQVVREMNRLGVLVDLSHVGERSSLEAIDRSLKPCVFSHSNPKARAPNPRNISDEQIRCCAAKGGVVGLSPWAPIAWTGGTQAPTLADFIGHVEYVVDLVGVDHVAVGTDSEATPGAYPDQLQRSLAIEYAEVQEPYRQAHPEIGTTVGFSSMEDLPNLTSALLERGWSPEDVQKLLGGNPMRIYTQAWEGVQP